MGSLLFHGQTVVGISNDPTLMDYDNTTSGLEATNVQSAIDELSNGTGVELTQAEYDALPSSKLTDGKTYFIKDGAGPADANLVHFLITYDETAYGIPVTFTNGTESKTCTLPASGTTTSFSCNSLGTWTITYMDRSLTVPTRYYGNYNIRISAGFTYNTWMELGGVTGTYESLDELLLDQVAVRRLMTVHASADYLVENMDDSLLSVITASDYAMKWIGLRDYICDKLMADYKDEMLESDNWEYILKDKVPVMTSDSAPYGVASASSEYSGKEAYRAFDGDDSTEWYGTTVGSGTQSIQYKFVNPIMVNKALVVNFRNETYIQTISKIVVSASNDNSNWITLYTDNTLYNIPSQHITLNFDNNNYYLYYRITVTATNTLTQANCPSLQTLQFYGRSLNVSVPTMTSNNAPYGEVSSSGEYGSDNASWKAFSQNSSVIWMNNNSSACWIQYKFSNKVSLGALTFLTNNSSNYTPQSFDLMASNDGSTWQTVQSYTPSCSASTKYTFSVNTTVSAKYWRIGNIVCTNSQYCQLGMIQFFGTDYSEREFAEGSNIKYLYDNGCELESLTYYSASNTNNVISTQSGGYARYVGSLADKNAIRAIVKEANSTSSTICCGVSSINDKASTTISALPYNIYLDVSSVTETNINMAVYSGTNCTMSVNEWWLE